MTNPDGGVSSRSAGCLRNVPDPQSTGEMVRVTQTEAVILKSALITFNYGLAKEQEEDPWFLKPWPSIKCHTTTTTPPTQSTRP